MTAKNYQKIRGLVILVLLVLMSLGWFHQSAIIPFLGVGFGLVLLSFLKLKVKGGLIDERQVKVTGQSAMVSFRVLMPVLGLTSLALFMSGGGEFYYVRALGIVLGYVTCLGLIIYLLAYGYFNRRHGG